MPKPSVARVPWLPISKGGLKAGKPDDLRPEDLFRQPEGAAGTPGRGRPGKGRSKDTWVHLFLLPELAKWLTGYSMFYVRVMRQPPAVPYGQGQAQAGQRQPVAAEPASSSGKLGPLEEGKSAGEEQVEGPNGLQQPPDKEGKEVGYGVLDLAALAKLEPVAVQLKEPGEPGEQEEQGEQGAVQLQEQEEQEGSSEGKVEGEASSEAEAEAYGEAQQPPAPEPLQPNRDAVNALLLGAGFGALRPDEELSTIPVQETQPSSPPRPLSAPHVPSGGVLWTFL